MKTNLRYRWLLPAGHTLLDLLLLCVLVWHAETGFRPRELTHVLQPVLLQEGAVSWDPTYIHPPPAFTLLAVGTLPAGIVSMSLRPRAWLQTPETSWDPVWLLIHEAFAIPFWILIGMRIDQRRSNLGMPMLCYLMARAIFAMLGASAVAAELGGKLQLLFWLGLAFYAVVEGAKRMVSAKARI